MSTILRDAAAVLAGRRSVDHVLYDVLWAIVDDHRAARPRSLRMNLDRLAEVIPWVGRFEGPAGRAYRETLRSVEADLRAALAPDTLPRRTADAAAPVPLSQQGQTTIDSLVSALVRRDALFLQREAKHLGAQSRARKASAAEQGYARGRALVARAFADPWACGHRSSDDLGRYLGPFAQQSTERVPPAHSTAHAAVEALRKGVGALGDTPAFGADSSRMNRR